MDTDAQHPIHTQNDNAPKTPHDIETGPSAKDSMPVFKSLGWLDRYLAAWIFLAMLIGIILGNFAPRTEDVLDKGRWVGVSIPIGACGLTRDIDFCYPAVLAPRASSPPS